MLKLTKDKMILDTEQCCAWCDGDGMLRIDPAIVRIMKSSGHWDGSNEVDESLMHDMGM